MFMNRRHEHVRTLLIIWICVSTASAASAPQRHLIESIPYFHARPITESVSMQLFIRLYSIYSNDKHRGGIGARKGRWTVCL